MANTIFHRKDEKKHAGREGVGYTFTRESRTVARRSRDASM